MEQLKYAIAAHKAGNLVQAEQHYLAHLQKNPHDHNALQLLGVVCLARGAIDNAIDLFERSLKLYPKQPHVCNNLAISFKKSGQIENAITSFEKAITLKPDYFDAYKNMLSVLLEFNDLNRVEALLYKASKNFGDRPELLEIKAKFLRNCERYAEALAVYKKLTQLQPSSIEFNHALALTYRLNGNSLEAIKIYQSLSDKLQHSYVYFHNYANALSDVGRLKEAEKLYIKAIEINPGYVESHINLSDILWEQGEREKFLQSFDFALKQLPGNQALLVTYIQKLLRINALRAATQMLDENREWLKNTAKYYSLRANTKRLQGHHSEAMALFKKATQMPDSTTEDSRDLSELMLECGEVKSAEEELLRLTDAEPDNKLNWALLGTAWKLLDDPREKQLNDYNRLVKEYVIGQPQGYAALEDFLEELRGYLAKVHTSTNNPLEQTLHHGTQTRGNLFSSDEPVIQQLVTVIHQAIQSYIDDLKNEKFTFAASEIKSDYTFCGSWSVQLSNNGFHNDHVHPMGSLSAVLYLNLPEVIKEPGKKQGWLKFGQPNLKLPTELPADKFIQPEIGKLVIFQSYMWHGTVPYQSDEPRMTIAFDIKFS